ncbi:MAG: hypothetical protein ACI9OJ_001267, partial [Myxococcota bacterium]
SLLQMPIEVADDHESTALRLRGNPRDQHGQLPLQFGASTSGFIQWTLSAAGLQVNCQEPKGAPRRPKVQNRPRAESSDVERFQVRTVCHRDRFSNGKPDALGAVAAGKIEPVAGWGDASRGLWPSNLLQGNDVGIKASEVGGKTLVVRRRATNGSGTVTLMKPGNVPRSHFECRSGWSIGTRGQGRTEQDQDRHERYQPSRPGRRGLSTP